jgi:hypothetical protein
MADALSALLALGIVVGLGTCLTVWASGWLNLADLYETKCLDGLISDGSYRVVRCKISLTSLVMAIESYPAGLLLRTPFPLRLVLSSVLIAWEKVSLGKSSALFFSGTRLQVAGWPHTLEVFGGAGKAIQKKLQA